jgi:hypothetical protein
MIVRLWALAWMARYLKYVPILGWRFSDTIGTKIEARMDRDVDVGDVTVDLDGDADRHEFRMTVDVNNELPIELTVAAVNVRVGYAESDETALNVIWSKEAHGPPPDNVTRSTIDNGETGTVEVEHLLPVTPPGDEIHVDGSLTVRGWLDIPATKRVPLGTLQREVPEIERHVST